MTYLVQPQGQDDVREYSIDFQVWRPTPTVGVADVDGGCYSLVGQNRFPGVTFSNDGLVSVEPERSNWISVRPGDVLGYFVGAGGGGGGGGRSSGDNGIQMDASFEKDVVFYAESGANLGGSGFLSVGAGGLLTSSLRAAPIISIHLSEHIHCVVRIIIIISLLSSSGDSSCPSFPTMAASWICPITQLVLTTTSTPSQVAPTSTPPPHMITPSRTITHLPTIGTPSQLPMSTTPPHTTTPPRLTANPPAATERQIPSPFTTMPLVSLIRQSNAMSRPSSSVAMGNSNNEGAASNVWVSVGIFLVCTAIVLMALLSTLTTLVIIIRKRRRRRRKQVIENQSTELTQSTNFPTELNASYNILDNKRSPGNSAGNSSNHINTSSEENGYASVNDWHRITSKRPSSEEHYYTSLSRNADKFTDSGDTSSGYVIPSLNPSTARLHLEDHSYVIPSLHASHQSEDNEYIALN